MMQGFCDILNVNIKYDVVLSLAKITPGYTAADLELVFKEIYNEPSIISELYVNP